VTGLSITYFHPLSPGATIVVLAIACYVLALLLRPLLGRARRHGGPDRLHDVEDDLQLREA
jgi:zinc transport system permease protein